jgi:MinD superfamily P-loop ATPase
MFICWSAKGGSGTTVVAASLALVLARSRPTVLADLIGDVPAALGLPEPAGPGLTDWMASPMADVAALTRLAAHATDTLQLLPRGTGSPPSDLSRWAALAAALHALGTVVVDAGVGVPPAPLLELAEQSLLVTRPCYLALRRAVSMDMRPTGIVLVQEPGRSLTARDVERALGAPVVAEVPYDPAVARAVDAGLLASRLPRTIARPLQSAA